MPKQSVHYTTYLAETMAVMSHEGALLVSVGKSGQPNVMTIGWGTIGWIWGKPIFIAFVRPSRYTYELMEQVDSFTVNIPTPELSRSVAYCGTMSGRDVDKFADRGLTATPSTTVEAPIIEECAIHYECRVVHRNDLLPETLAAEIDRSAYASGDYHRVYYGEILATSADVDAAAKLPSGAGL